MGRPSLATERRAALIVAAIDEIHAQGTLGVTMAAIAARAGVSGPLASHYFGTKDALITEALRDMLRRLNADVIAALRAANGPRARLSALIRANFGPGQFCDKTISAWLNFYVRAQADEPTQRLLRIYFRRLQSNLLHEVRQLAPQARAEALADTLAALIDGFYLRHALRQRPPDAGHVVARIEETISLYLSEQT
ncbi:MAG: transcriptional regulator BetI [Rhodobacterales bacterium]|nr:MAG: transcriptional regulator BetI [Rhodobacterales bacterium]